MLNETVVSRRKFLVEVVFPVIYIVLCILISIYIHLFETQGWLAAGANLQVNNALSLLKIDVNKCYVITRIRNLIKFVDSVFCFVFFRLRFLLAFGTLCTMSTGQVCAFSRSPLAWLPWRRIAFAGFRFLRAMYILSVPDILQIGGVLRDNRVIQVARISLQFLTLWLVAAGFIHMVRSTFYFSCFHFLKHLLDLLLFVTFLLTLLVLLFWCFDLRSWLECKLQTGFHLLLLELVEINSEIFTALTVERFVRFLDGSANAKVAKDSRSKNKQEANAVNFQFSLNTSKSVLRNLAICFYFRKFVNSSLGYSIFWNFCF